VGNLKKATLVHHIQTKDLGPHSNALAYNRHSGKQFCCTGAVLKTRNFRCNLQMVSICWSVTLQQARKPCEEQTL
jgi:hypothetical protein